MGWLRKIANLDVEEASTKVVNNALTVPAFASNPQGESILAKIYEVNGFWFLFIGLLADFKIRTTKGCEATIKLNNQEFALESDSTEFDTDYSKQLKLGFTKFDFDMEQNNIDALLNGELQELTIHFKNRDFSFIDFNLEALLQDSQEEEEE